MEAWLEYVVRQLILYSLPVMVSLTLACWLEILWTRTSPPGQALHALHTPTAWGLPLLGIAVHQPVVLAFGQPVREGVQGAAARLAAHLLLLAAGFLLYAWALAVQPVQGVPPLHQWWAKLMMYFNLCVVMAHLLPLPGLLAGEILRYRFRLSLPIRAGWTILALLSLTPLLQALIGRPLIFPLYQQLAIQAAALAR